jgi:pimeloyl-ACP methyl ester carboxylesterase
MTALQTFEPDARAIPFADEGEGPAVVLLPGRGLNIGSLGTLAHVLVEEGFRIVRVGVRRADAAASLTLHDLAQDVVDVVGHLGLATAWIGGHGFGGTLARTVALDHHDLVEGIMLLGVESPEGPSEEAAAALQTAFSDAADLDASGALRVLAGDSVDLQFAQRVFSLGRDLAAERVQSAALAATPAGDWTPLAPSLPVLILQGTDDRVTVPANGDSLQASAPDRASLARIDGGGHLFVMTHPGEIGMQVEDYLAWD